MFPLVSAVHHIASLQPSPLPDIPPQRLPNISAVAPLAAMTGGNPQLMQQKFQTLLADRSKLDSVIRRGQGFIRTATGDFVSLGMELLRRALPHAVGYLSPIPGARAAALAGLEALAQEFIGRALARVAALRVELESLAEPLVDIAGRDTSSAFTSSPTVMQEIPMSSSSPGSAAGARAVDAALAQVGTPYVWGGTSPAGFDCSGLTQYAWRQAGVELPRLAQEQTVGRQVQAHELVKGDLVVWDGHVAMYAGDGKIVEAGSPVQVNPLRTNNMGMTFKGFWRPTG